MSPESALREWQETITLTYLANRILCYCLAVKGVVHSLYAVIGEAKPQDVNSDALVWEYRQAIDIIGAEFWPESLLDIHQYTELEDMEEHTANQKIVEAILAFR